MEHNDHESENEIDGIDPAETPNTGAPADPERDLANKLEVIRSRLEENYRLVGTDFEELAKLEDIPENPGPATTARYQSMSDKYHDENDLNGNKMKWVASVVGAADVLLPAALLGGFLEHLGSPALIDSIRNFLHALEPYIQNRDLADGLAVFGTLGAGTVAVRAGIEVFSVISKKLKQKRESAQAY